MKIQVFKLIIVAGLLSGCQSTGVRTEKAFPKSVPDLSAKLEGTQHRIWKEASYKGIRSELKEGEVITFRNVEAKAYGNSGYFYFGHIYSADGYMLFDKKYSLSDVGVIGFKGRKITKQVNPEAVKANRGVRYHGNSEIQDGFSTTYWKTTGGDSPNATPVRDYKNSRTNTHKIAEDEWSGLRLSCFKGGVYVSFSNSEKIYAADNENITVTVYYPYAKGKDSLSKSVGHTGVSLKVDPYIERIMLEEEAIKLEAYSHANRDFT